MLTEPAISQIDLGRPVRAYLLTKLRYLAIDQYRNRSRATILQPKHWRCRRRRIRTPPEIIERAEEHQQLTTAVDELPPNLRRLVQLQVHEGLAAGAIAKSLGEPLASVQSKLFLAHDVLRERLQPHFFPKDKPP